MKQQVNSWRARTLEKYATVDIICHLTLIKNKGEIHVHCIPTICRVF